MTHSRRSGRKLAAGGLVAIVGAGAGLSMAISGFAGLELFVAYAGMGAFLAFRRPRSPLGWLLMLTGCGLALGNARVDADPALLVSGTSDVGLALASWSNSDAWALAIAGMIGLALLFPSGRLPRGRMAWVVGLGSAATMTLVCLIALGPTVNVTAVSGTNVDLPNPLAVASRAGLWKIVPPLGLLYFGLLAIWVAATLGLLARFVRATGLERLQYRWLVAAIVLVVITNGSWGVLNELNGPQQNLALFGVLVAYPTVPIAIGVAVLRYRLYEIDRIISRSVEWALLTAILAAVFAGLVVTLQALARPVTGESQLAVAASTLAVFALFGPIRRRVQAFVDRRFDRARYDAVRVTEGFSTRLRDGLDIDTVTGELASTTVSALRPASVSIWLRRHEADAPIR
jgi:hypothetical protein